MAVPTDVLFPDAALAGALPSTLRHFEFRTRLGEGGHGEVYEAWDMQLQRCVAIKRVKREAVATGMDLIHEARMAASLNHPAFVKVYAVEETVGSQFIVMELVPGRTLKQILSTGKPALEAALDWVRQIAEAMQDAHHSGLVHGDLKPSNVIIEPSGVVRILDFGLALRTDVLATTTVTQSDPQGTIAYMAPERLLGNLPDVCGDVYALGVIFYEVLTGTRPFPTLSGLALAAAHVQSSSDTWAYPDQLDTRLIALIRSMTAKLSEHRIPTIGKVLARLDQVGRELSSTDVPAEPSEPSTRQPSSKRIRKVAVGITVLLFAVGPVTWQLARHADSLSISAKPYSEVAEMEQGLKFLKLYDRPGDLEKAKAHFDRILSRSPDNAAAVAGISLVYNLQYMSDRQDEVWLQKADASAQLALKLNDQLALSHIAEGSVLDRNGRFTRALEAYDRALGLDPNNYFAWYGKVETLRNARLYDKARSMLADALRQFPQERAFLDELGTLEFEQGRYREAEAAFRRSIAVQPDAVMAYSNLNAVLLHENRNDEALRVLQQGLQIRASATLYGNLGTVLFVRGDYVGAAKAFEDAVSPTRGAPGKYINWANLGDTLLWLPGREKQARKAYEKAMQLLEPRLQRTPGDVTLLSRMGLYCARVADAKRALGLAGHAIQLAPQDATVQFRGGLTYELLGKRSLALAAIKVAKRLGYPVQLIDTEPALLALRRDPGYESN